jgi:tetratricopeptide (TPR) repeat protein
MSRLKISAALSLVALVAACASAGDRLNEGISAESAGRYYEAAMRYVDALDKDENLTEARDRLRSAGAVAIEEGLDNVHQQVELQDPLGAASEFHPLDRLVSAARSVGVRLPIPDGYGELRRNMFDAAINTLMALAEESENRRQFTTARNAYEQIRDDFEPDAEQRQASLEGQSSMFLAWARDEEANGRFRGAFQRADDAMAVSGGAPADMIDEAMALQDRVLEAGTRFVAIFPVELDPRLEGRGESDPALQLADILELEHWREPPPFVAVADPVAVRQLIRRYRRPGRALRPARILEEMGSDFGVLIDIVNLTRSEQNVRETVRTARTEGGGTQRYTRQEGTQRYEIQVRVVIVDRAGREVENFASGDNESGPFQRGVYDGDLSELNLSRSDAMLFDEARQAQARAVIEDRLLAQLAERIADQVFERVLRRVR